MKLREKMKIFVSLTLWVKLLVRAENSRLEMEDGAEDDEPDVVDRLTYDDESEMAARALGKSVQTCIRGNLSLSIVCDPHRCKDTLAAL